MLRINKLSQITLVVSLLLLVSLSYALGKMIEHMLYVSQAQTMANESAAALSDSPLASNHESIDWFAVPKSDPWKNSMQARLLVDERTRTVSVRSAGPDGEFGTGDDVKADHVRFVEPSD